MGSSAIPLPAKSFSMPFLKNDKLDVLMIILSQILFLISNMDLP
jgi:hypothetical protein